MPSFLKNLSLKKTSLNKLLVFSFLSLIIFGLLLPINFSQAQATGLTALLGGSVKSGALWIAQAILGTALQLTLLMAEAVLAIGIAFLGWIVGWTTSGGLSLTNPANNDIIKIGWTLIRDFANIGFILGLVYIGLSTALGIVGFQTKKIFGWLLIMALAINFTPLFCGLIVDASNLVGKFFMEEMANWSTLKDIFSIHGNALVSMLFDPPSLRPILIFLSLTAFGFVAGFTMFIFALLLLVRMVAIQILVILSPLAFLAYIFPKTRSYFTTWWNQFLQWSFVGAIGGFFLYLSRVALFYAKEEGLYKIATPDDPTGGVLGSLAPFAVVIVFLIIGLYITLQTSAMGANYVIGAAKTVGKKMPKGVKWVNEKATRKLRQKTGQTLASVGKWMGGVKGAEEMKEIEATRKAQGLETEKWHRTRQAGRAVRGWAVRGLGYGVEKAGVKIEAQTAKATKAEIDKEKKEAKGKPLDAQYDSVTSVLPNKQIGALLAAIEDGNIKDLKEIKNLTNGQIEKIMIKTLKTIPDAFKDMRNAFPEIASRLAGPIKEGGMKKLSEFTLKRAGIDFNTKDREAGFENLFEKIIGTIKPTKMEQWDFSTMKKAAQSEAAHKFWTGAHLTEGGKAFGASFLGAFHEKMLELKASFYKKYNPRLKKYIESFAGQSLGIGFKKAGFKKPIPAPKTYIQPWEEKKEKRRTGRVERAKSRKPSETGAGISPSEETERIRRRKERGGKKPPETGAGI